MCLPFAILKGAHVFGHIKISAWGYWCRFQCLQYGGLWTQGAELKTEAVPTLPKKNYLGSELAWPDLKWGELVDVWIDIIRCEEFQKKIIGRWHVATQARSTSQNSKWHEMTHLIIYMFYSQGSLYHKIWDEQILIKSKHPKSTLPNSGFPLRSAGTLSYLAAESFTGLAWQKVSVSSPKNPLFASCTNWSIWMFPKIVGFSLQNIPCLIGFSIIFTMHFWGTTIFGNIHMEGNDVQWYEYPLTRSLPNFLVLLLYREWILTGWSPKWICQIWDRNSGNWKKEFGTENLPGMWIIFLWWFDVLKNDNAVSGKAYVKLYPKLISYLHVYSIYPVSLAF